MGKRSRVMKAGDGVSRQNGVYRQNGVTYEGTIHNIEPRQATFVDNVWGFGDTIGKGVYDLAANTAAGVQHVGTGIGSAVTNTVGAIIPQYYKIGDKVEAQFIISYGKPNGKWYSAEITEIYDDGSYGVKYYDGMERTLEKKYIRRGGKSRKQRKSHKNNKSRKNRKSRKQRK